MGVFTINTFASFAGLLLAVQKLAIDPNPLNRVKALTELATNGDALAAVLRDSGLTPLAKEMAARAEEADRAYAHDGPAKDDARAIFWQVAPAALADPAAIVAGGLDADTVTDGLVGMIRTSPHGPDFARTAMAEVYFRAIARPTLAVMLAKADFIATITPELWRTVLARQGVEVALLERLDSKIDAQSAQLDRMEALLDRYGPPPLGLEATVIELARRVAPRTQDINAALNELRRAVEMAVEMQARGEAGSNVDAFVADVLRRLAALTGEGRLDEAVAAADAAVERAEAGLAQLLDAAIRQHLIAFDAEGAARQIVRRLEIEASGSSTVFEQLLHEQNRWHQRGRAMGVSLDVEIAIGLAEAAVARALDRTQRAPARTGLGNALQTLGEWETGTESLQKAEIEFRKILAEWSRQEEPVGWAGTQANLGLTLSRIGQRESNPTRLREAVDAIREALDVWTPEEYSKWHADAQLNLGNALRILGELTGDNEKIKESLNAFRLALRVYERSPDKTDWGIAQGDYGTALSLLGGNTNNVEFLIQARDALNAAISVRTREIVPLRWAMLQRNLGTALCVWASVDRDVDRIGAAIAAYDEALSEHLPERVPLEWALTIGARGVALHLRALWTGNLFDACQAVEQLADAANAMTEFGRDADAASFTEQYERAMELVGRLSDI